MAQAPDTFRKAEELLALDPAPADLVDQIEALRKQTPREWRRQFDAFFEAAIAASDDPGSLS